MATVILAEGFVDSGRARIIARAVEEMQRQGQVKIVVDWETAECVEPMAIGHLLARHHALVLAGGELKFSRMTPAVSSVFSKYSVGGLVEEYSTLEDAIASFDDEWASGNECQAM